MLPGWGGMVDMLEDRGAIERPWPTEGMDQQKPCEVHWT